MQKKAVFLKEVETAYIGQETIEQFHHIRVVLMEEITDEFPLRMMLQAAHEKNGVSPISLDSLPYFLTMTHSTATAEAALGISRKQNLFGGN